MKDNRSNPNDLKSSNSALEHLVGSAKRRILLLIAVLMSPLFTFGATAKVGVGSGRLIPLVAGILALFGVWLGRKAVKNAGKRSDLKYLQIALLLSISATCLAIVHASNAQGGVGTGNGLAGAVIAMLIGLIGVLQCVFAWMKMKRANLKD